MAPKKNDVAGVHGGAAKNNSSVITGQPSTKVPGARKPPRGASKDADLGNALRSVYQQTIAEQIPSEMLDLLGKLD